MRLKPLESEIQAGIFEWMSWAYPTHNELFFHVPNGGSRHPAEARNLKKQGVKKGVPDTMLAMPCGGYHGLFIEFKRPGEKPNTHQEKMLAALRAQGYYTTWVDSVEAGSAVIENYIRGKL